MKKTTQLKSLLESSSIDFILEAHNGIGARIVEEAGFRGIWASGLTMSASLGVRDNNEASWTQVLEILEFMSDATGIPILLDGDTGYGNFNNVRRLVRKLEQRGIAGVCMEDKLFPKTNSFINSERQPLADIQEFSGKIRAAKDTQQDEDFCVVARTEAFIAGWGLGVALARAEAYRQAGADAVLIHSKLSQPEDILSFMDEWAGRAPVVIVPTTYYSTPTQVFEEAGISLVIWANHLLRGSIGVMQELAAQLRQEKNLLNVEDRVVPVKEVFRLQGAQELQEAEQRYLPVRSDERRAIILAASRGADLGDLTLERPKTMLPVGGEPIIQKLVSQFNRLGIQNVIAVVGYRAEAIDVPSLEKVTNDRFEETKELYSLACAMHLLDRETYITFGDILFKHYILLNLQEEEGDIVVVVDANVDREHHPTRYTDFVQVSRAYKESYTEEPAYLLRADPGLEPGEADGEWIGMLKVNAAGAAQVKKAIEALKSRDGFCDSRMCDLFNHLVDSGVGVRVAYVSGHWLDIDDLEIYSESTSF